LKSETKEQKAKAPSPDAVLKDYWRDNERFADLFNSVLFAGKNYIKPEGLQEKDTDESTIIYEKDGSAESVARHRDIIKSYSDNTDLVIVGIENQKYKHYAMPVRSMVYDSLNYVKQCKRLENINKKGRTPAEFLSGMRKGDRINPIINIVIYYGEKHNWDGPILLSDMMDIDEDLKPYINDYKIHVLNMRSAAKLPFRNKDNKDFFSVMEHHYRKGKKINIEEFENEFSNLEINHETLAAIGAATNDQGYIKYAYKNKEEVSMCEATKELRRQGRVEGRAEGRVEGRVEGRAEAQAEISKKMLELNMPIEQIIEVTGLSREEIEQFSQ
jgi:hypothetical protein